MLGEGECDDRRAALLDGAREYGGTEDGDRNASGGNDGAAAEPVEEDDPAEADGIECCAKKKRNENACEVGCIQI